MAMHSNPQGPQPRVLLVDDAPDNRLLMTLFLRRSGVEILTARNGEEALQITASMSPDLVVLDLSTTGMSCHEVCKRIKANPATSATPVVLLISKDEREERIKGLQAGADDFFDKPLHKDEFLVRVRSLIDATNARQQADDLSVATNPGSYRLRDEYKHLRSRKLMDQILATPGAPAQQDYQNRFDAVILFADLRGFTRLAEKIPPTDVVLLLNEYFSLLTNVAYRHNGIIFNMAGDSLLVGFGVPFEQPDAADRAVNCAYQMLAEFDALSIEWRARHGLETGLGIGINKGEVVAGNVGSAAYSNFTIIGDAVNIASRLMQRARAGELLLSDRVMDVLKSTPVFMQALPLPPLTVRGRTEPIGLYCIPYKGRLDTRI
jgi:class 3 adenylate cyclase